MALADTAALVASLELKDKFSATAAKYDRTVTQMEQRTRRLEQVGETIGRGARNTVENVRRGAVLVGGFVAANVALGIRSLTELGEAQAQTEARIKSTGGAANVTADQVRGLAESLESLTTIDDKAIQRGENMLLTFKNIRNEVGAGNDIFNQATKTVLDLATAMGTEPEQAALQLGKALNDPVRGLTALRRVGVQFTEEQEQQIRTMVEAGRTMDAQKIILRELTSEFGGSAEAFGEKGPGATMRRFADAVEEGQQALARGFLPLMERLAALAQDTFNDPKFIAGIEDFGEGLAGGLDQLVDIATKLPWEAIGSSLQVAGAGAKAVLTFFTSMPDWVQTAVLTGWGFNRLTGGALGSLVGQLGKAAIGGLRGSSPATPVFTKEVGGVPGGGGGATGTGGGGLGRIGGALSVLAGLGLAIEAGLEFQRQSANVKVASDFVQKVVDERARNANVAELQKLNADLQGQIDREMGDPLKGLLKFAFVNGQLEREQADVQKQIREQSSAFASSAAARWSQEQSENYAQLNAINASAAQTGQHLASLASETGRGFSSTNASLGISNAKLAAIEGKDFSPDVNVNVPVTTQVSINDVIRSVTHASFSSQVPRNTGTGFTP